MLYHGLKLAQVQQVLERGQTSRTSSFFIRWQRNDNQENFYAVIISKKSSKLAVERNRVKRVIKAWLMAQNLIIKKGFKVVIITRPQALLLSPGKLKEELKSLFVRTGLLLNEETGIKNYSNLPDNHIT